MRGLRPPFVLIEDGSEQGIYPSLKAVTDHVETIDVLDGIYRVYDSAGRIISLQAETDTGGVITVATDDATAKPWIASYAHPRGLMLPGPCCRARPPGPG